MQPEEKDSAVPPSSTAAIIGGGVIGGAWAARFRLSGWNVRIFDPSPASLNRAERMMENARRSYPALYDGKLPEEGSATVCGSVGEAVRDAAWVQESVSERLELKRDVFRQIQQSGPPGVAIASSTSGFKPSDLQGGALRPDEIIVAHPFNPVYLIPLVEIVASPANARETVRSAGELLSGLGMHPVTVRNEIDAHVADRLLEAVWREALWLVKDGVATTGEIDDIIRFGFGLRWAQMGLFESYRIAGGDEGMAHFLEQFGPCLSLPWTRLTDVPELDAELISLISRQSDEQSGNCSIDDLERARDDNLVTILRGLKKRNWGAGKLLLDCEKRFVADVHFDLGKPIATAERKIPVDWTDYNGHINETHYLELFSRATDRFMEFAGCDDAYVKSGMSFFTLETNLRHLGEVFAGEDVRVETVCVFADGRKLHLFHALFGSDANLKATGEHLLLHVDLGTRKSSDPPPEIKSKLIEIFESHSEMKLPDWIAPKLGFRRAGT